MTPKRIQFLGIPLDTGVDVEALCGLMRKKGQLQMISFINPGAWALARKDKAYLDALGDMSLVLADGIGVSGMCQLLTREVCPRVSFDMTSLADPFFKTAIEKKLSIVLVGGRPGVADHVQQKLQLQYPELKIVDTIHGFGDLEPKITTIKTRRADIVIIGMGAPRQEAFLLQLRDAGFNGMGITCGGFFDQYLEVEGTQYYPGWIDRYNLRFLYRLYKEPGRLSKRYLVDYSWFFFALVRPVVEQLTALAKMIASRIPAKRA